MASERARRFAKALMSTGLVVVDRDKATGFQRTWERLPGISIANDVPIDLEATIATALDRYEAEAWTAITDAPGSWPTGPVLARRRSKSRQVVVLYVEAKDLPLHKRWTHWRPLPAPPKETGK